MSVPSQPLLVELWRGRIVESAHAGAIAIVDADGALVKAIGDIDRPIYPRSAVKLLQALPLVASGAADALGLGDEELALACASHGGEEDHVRTASAMLAKAGLDADALECGSHWPGFEEASRALAARGEAPCPLHNNCSGKHAGFAALATAMRGSGDLRGWLEGYVKPDHPLMREVTSSIAAATGFDLERADRAIDGCSIPTFAIPLRQLAHAFARAGTGVGLAPGHAQAARRLRRAVARAPRMVAGTGRFDTRVIERLGERVFCKVGAEGVYCAALPELGFGVAMKMTDGNTARAVEVAMAAVIEALLPLDVETAAWMRELSEVPLKNWNGIAVGRLAAAHSLREALGARQ